MSKLILVSNRLPVTVEKKKGVLQYTPSVGGLATGLGSFYKNYNSIWIGWCGLPSDRLDGKEKKKIERRLLKDFKSYSTFLTRKDIRLYYYGFCNKTIWPLFHYFTESVVYDQDLWNAYTHVNKLFCQAVLKIAKPDDVIWIHDYQLMLLPRLIRKKLPNVTIGYFLHIPFPSFEVFRLLPWREEILEGLLGSDLLGFHTFDYGRHCLSSVRRILGYENTIGQVNTGKRVIKIDAFPMGINFEKYRNAAKKPEVKRQIKSIRKKIGDRKIILSVDRLDYTKGILKRLEAYDAFLKKYPEYKEKVTLILVAVPSRTAVDTYAQLKQQLDEMVGAINGKYGSIGWSPIQYFYRSLSFATLCAYYHLADVALVTPLRDGMNLIAKEYIASKAGGKGVLVLGEMAGASSEMGEALIVNPNTKEDIVEALQKALTMPGGEQIKHNSVLEKRLKRYDIVKWANDFMERLNYIKKIQENLLVKKITPQIREKIVEDYKEAKTRLIFLDYDGTLVSFAGVPEKAKPDRSLFRILKTLSSSPGNQLILISGREKKTLDAWFGKLDISLIAEHGVWLKPIGEQWSTIGPLRQDWKKQIRSLMENYVDRTPGSFVEEKDYSLVWHYRQTDHDLADIRVKELKDALLQLTENLNLEIMDGNKVIEIKSAGINKGLAALHWIRNHNWEFIVAIGDDVTDENIFDVLPDFAYSIKVGLSPSLARFNLDSVKEVRSLLKHFMKSS